MILKFTPAEVKEISKWLSAGRSLRSIATEKALAIEEVAQAIAGDDFQNEYEKFFGSLEDAAIKESVSRQLDSLACSRAVEIFEELLLSQKDDTKHSAMKTLLKKAGLLEEDKVNIGPLYIEEAVMVKAKEINAGTDDSGS
jgi:hypothetical protein